MINLDKETKRENVIKENDLIVLYLGANTKWLIRAEPNKEFHTHRGIINLSEFIGKEWGMPVPSSTKDAYFYALKPLVTDLALLSPRTTNIIYPKDAGFILIKAGITPGSTVVEAGTGSGAFTIVLANYVKPNGHVYSYDIRKDMIKIVDKKLKKAGVTEFVTLKNKNICEGIDEKNVDVIVLDLATPWLVVEHAKNSLTGGGVFVSYSPTINQTMKTVQELKKYGFIGIETQEIFLRDILVREGKTRPASRMVGHTGYITFARKVYSIKRE